MARQRRSRAEWTKLVAEAQASGLTQCGFAEARGLSAQTLSWWVSRLRRENRRDAKLVAVDVVEDAAAEFQAIRVELRGDRTLVVPANFDATALRRLVVSLEEIGAC